MVKARSSVARQGVLLVERGFASYL